MTDDLTALHTRILADLAATTDVRAWDALRVAVLGKSGELTALLKQLGSATQDERKTRGAALNHLKSELATAFDAHRDTLATAALAARLAADRIDITLPPRPAQTGAIHPISRTIEEITAIFGAMGFSVGEGFDIQTDWYNFSALNIPAHHPARADQDTFYLAGDTTPPLLLRTQTSDVQIISMLTREPPLRVIAPGRTYRADHDATHSPMFHQCEGIVIDRAITMAHLKGCLTDFLRAYFDDPGLPVRFRASYFPFTEPSMEVDIGWNRRTAEIGSGTDWLEILGSGMVHPRVLANCGLDAREWQGFAFGMGIERLTMLKHGIPDLRPFYESDTRWLRHYGTSPLAPVISHEAREVKFTLAWLRDHLDTTATLTELTETLTRIGLELEAVTDRAAPLAAFVVAAVTQAEPHPNADRLRVCTVNTGTDTVSVVCGAPNARAGMRAVFAPPGATIPATGAVLKIGDIRGVASAGMLLSAREMGLGEEHDGILELPADAPIGTPYATYAGLDDPIIDIAVTPNRGDALSVRGIARDLAAAGQGTLKPWHPPAITAAGDSPIAWHNDFPQACPWILGRAIHGVRNGPSPPWLAARLTAIGLRPISALVDVTNFFAVDLGRPLHVFDADKVAGDLHIRPGRTEILRALDGRDYTLTDQDCVLADARGAQSLGGVIGGAATGCDEHTTSVFIECALFDPVRVALTGRRLAIATDARQRFERGLDPALLPVALDAATAMIMALCGGTPTHPVSAGHEPPWRRTATLTYARLASISGITIPAPDAIAALQNLGFSVAEQTSTDVTVKIPSWRTDIAARRTLHPAPTLPQHRLDAAIAGCADIEPQADLIEEILRLHGLDRIPATSLPTPAIIPTATLTPTQTRIARARRTLAAAGLLECVTFSFTDHATAALFATTPPIRIANPIAADLDHLRPTPLATLACAAARNAARLLPDTQLFEIGPAFQTPTEHGQPRIAATLRTGHTPRNWRAPARPVDAYDAKSDALTVLLALGVPPDSLTVTADAPAHYHPTRSGTLRQGPKLPLAYFGPLHPTICAALDLPDHTAAAEILLPAIPLPKRRRRSPPDLPSLHPVRRDFAFIAPASIHADQLIRAARAADRQLITTVTLFDVYPLPNGTTSLAMEITLQPTTHTLSDTDLDATSAKIIAAVTKATGATLR